MNFFRKYSLRINKVWLLWAFLLLTGCAHMNSDFTCPMKPGQMCNSLDEVNTMVDQGVVGGPSMTTVSSNNNKYLSNGSEGIMPYPMEALNVGEPLRYGESVQRIWVAPYEDKAGNYYQPSLMYAVVRPSHWIGNPVQAVTSQD